MIKYSAKKSLFILCLVLSLFSFQKVFAETVKINAGVLPSIWYSSFDINDQDSIKIFGGIQNHSDTGFSGTATIFVDSKENTKTNFISKPDSLVEISGAWTAVSGNHSIKMTITSISPLASASNSTFGTSSLLSFESDEARLFVKQKITLADVQNTATKVAIGVVDSIDKLANTLADNIEEFKKPVPSENGSTVASQNTVSDKSASPMGKVLGAETQYKESVATSTGFMNSKVGVSIFNKILDFLSMIVRNWKITLFVVIALVLIIRFMI